MITDEIRGNLSEGINAESYATVSFVFNNNVVHVVSNSNGIWYQLKDVASALDYKKLYDLSRLVPGAEFFNDATGVRLVHEFGLVRALHKSIKRDSKVFIKWMRDYVRPKLILDQYSDNQVIYRAFCSNVDLEKIYIKEAYSLGAIQQRMQ
ncbi:MAG: hypothetical protein GYB17_16945 [Gammaproteobacteria bacterium]|nr:hypothetical protein [Gammaproteobacteria bacterium]